MALAPADASGTAGAQFDPLTDISPDGLTYTFHIRDGVRWHDKAPMNGRELTAHDIEYDFHRILGMGDFAEAGPTPFGGAGPLKNIPWKSIAATDDATVVMKLTEPHLDFLRVVLMSEVTSIMPPEVIEQHGDVQDWRNLVGTGPFILTDYVEDSQITWAKNPDYWGHDEKYPENRLPYVDELRAMIIPEEGSVLAALRSGKLDFRTWNTSVDSAESIQKTNPEIAVHTLWFRSQDSFMPNMYKPPYGDINVRRAMQMALDNETAAATLWKGFADPTPQGRVGIPGYYIPFEQWDEEVINVGGVILAEASLSFLGFGLPIKVPSWGAMLSREGRRFMEQAPLAGAVAGVVPDGGGVQFQHVGRCHARPARSAPAGRRHPPRRRRRHVGVRAISYPPPPGVRGVVEVCLIEPR